MKFVSKKEKYLRISLTAVRTSEETEVSFFCFFFGMTSEALGCSVNFYPSHLNRDGYFLS